MPDLQKFACLRINNKEWFEREDFQKMLTQPGVATWNTCEEGYDEFSDVFVWVDTNMMEGSDYNAENGVPEDIQLEIKSIIEKEYIYWEGGIVWISPVE